MSEQPPYQPPPEGQPPVPPPAYQPPPPPPAPPPAPPGGYQPPPPPPAPPGAYPQPAGYVPAAAANNQKALISLILSIVSLFFCGLIGIAGIILGSSAKKEIKQTGEQGESLATAGQIIGAISLILWVALPLLIFLGIMGAIVGSNAR